MQQAGDAEPPFTSENYYGTTWWEGDSSLGYEFQKIIPRKTRFPKDRQQGPRGNVAVVLRNYGAASRKGMTIDEVTAGGMVEKEAVRFEETN